MSERSTEGVHASVHSHTRDSPHVAAGLMSFHTRSAQNRDILVDEVDKEGYDEKWGAIPSNLAPEVSRKDFKHVGQYDRSV